MKGEIAGLWGETHSLRADIAAHLAAMQAEHEVTRDQIISLREMVEELHSAVIRQGATPRPDAH